MVSERLFALADGSPISVTGIVVLFLALLASVYVYRRSSNDSSAKERSTFTTSALAEDDGDLPSDPWLDFVENDETAKNMKFSSVDTSMISVDDGEYSDDEKIEAPSSGADFMRRPTAMLRRPGPTRDSMTKKRPSQQIKPTLPISRYLWEDPGDANGVAYLRIDNLPQLDSAEMIPWNEEVGETSAELDGEGLKVLVKTKTGVDYGLRIAKLYGEVDEVTVTTTERLLVRLQKKKGLVDEKSNFEAWPQPHKKSVAFLTEYL